MRKDAKKFGRSVLAQLTADISRLPLPELAPHILAVLADGICRAWCRVPAEIKAAANEAELNASIGIQFAHEITQDDRLRMVALMIERGVETISFDGEHLEERPDLSITLRGPIQHRLFPFTVECKLIDKTHRKTIRLYCNNGIQRFVDGCYGWVRPQAMMIAYVRDNTAVVPDLRSYLEKSASTPSDPYATLALPESGPCNPPRSWHSRKFQYPDRPPNEAPGPISLLHVWLNADL